MGKVVVAARLPGRIDEILAGHELVWPPAGAAQFARGPLVAALRDADALLALLAIRVDDALLDGAPRLRVVANYAVGYDNVDLAATGRRGIVVTNTPGVLTDATADLAMALILAVTRRVVEGVDEIRNTHRCEWEPLKLLGMSLQGKRLGIIGLGRIGRAVAERARAFGMEVAWCGRGETLDELLATSDVVSIHAPLTDETHRLIDAAALARMKPGSYLINTARGRIVDENALCDALESGHLRGAGLDVFEDEPRVNPRLLAMPHVVAVPHIGSATDEARTAMARIAAEDVARFLRGEKPVNVIP